MDTQLYYLFSTIAQVLAALVALLGLFWVFFIPYLERLMRIWTKAVIREIDVNDRRKKKYHAKIYEAILADESIGPYREAYWKALPNRINWMRIQDQFNDLYNLFVKMNHWEENSIIRLVISRFEELDGKRMMLTINLRRVLIGGGILILLNIIGIILIPTIVCYSLHGFFGWLDAVLAGIVGFLAVRAVIKAIKITNHIEPPPLSEDFEEGDSLK